MKCYIAFASMTHILVKRTQAWHLPTSFLSAQGSLPIVEFPPNCRTYRPSCMSVHYLDTACASMSEPLPSPHPATNIAGRHRLGQ